jgi:hypothetical protein
MCRDLEGEPTRNSSCNGRGLAAPLCTTAHLLMMNKVDNGGGYYVTRNFMFKEYDGRISIKWTLYVHKHTHM